MRNLALGRRAVVRVRVTPVTAPLSTSRTAVAAVLVCLVSCSKRPTPPDVAGAPAPAPAPTPAPSTLHPSCPPDMVLVDGDYCTELELTCKKSWYANWNDKTICEKFVPPSKCTGKLVHKRFCIDEYEYPNKKGERPRVMFKFHEAQELCAA